MNSPVIRTGEKRRVLNMLLTADMTATPVQEMWAFCLMEMMVSKTLMMITRETYRHTTRTTEKVIKLVSFAPWEYSLSGHPGVNNSRSL